MNHRRGRKALHAVVVAAFAAAGPVVLVVPDAAEAATIQNPPDRLYVGERGATYQVTPVPYIVPVPIGLLTFDGTDDPVSGDTRTIAVQTGNGAGGCTIEDDPTIGDPDFVIGGCSRVVLNVVHGRIWMGPTTEMFRDNPDGSPNLNDPAFMYDTGAILDAFGGGDSDDDPNQPAGYLQLELNGTQQELNDTLERLVYAPDDDYHYTASAPEERLSISLSPADGTASAQHSVEIRVLDDNDWPTLEGPTVDKTADPEVPLVIANEFTVGDIDNDEAIDDDAQEPLKDGVYDEMLLIGFLDCGADATVDMQTGFRYQGGTFDTTATDLTDLVSTYFVDRDSTDGDLAQISMAVTAVLDGIEAIPGVPPGIATIPLSNNGATDYQSFFVGVADDIEEVQYALDQITFLHDIGGASCNLLTIVSDLGNNGLPLQYFGSPPLGFELPFIGFDYNEFDIDVTDPEQLDISWDSSTYMITEGDPGDSVLAIAPSASVDPAIHPAFTFAWEAVPGTATEPPSDNDYQGAQFDSDAPVAADDTAWTLGDINLVNDNLVEGDEQFTITITPPAGPPGRPAGWQIVSGQPTVTVIIIDDDDAPKSVSVADASATEGDTGSTDMTFTLSLGTGPNGPIMADGNESVSITLVDGTATSPADYGAAVPAVVTFAPGATTATVTVPVVGDTLNEGPHEFTLQLGDPEDTTIADGTATGSIIDDDVPRTVTVADVSANEGNAGTTPFMFTLTLDQPAKAGDSVVVSTVDGAAVAPGDFAAIANQIVNFTAGTMQATVTVNIVGDTTIEPTQTFALVLSAPSNVTISDGTAVGTIVNDDGLPAASINDVTVTEGDAGLVIATFTITLADPAFGGETIDVATANATATAGSDYVGQSGTVTFALGEDTKTVAVTVNGDQAAELDETLLVNLSNPSGIIITDGQGVGTITNDDIGVSIAPTATVEEGDVGTIALTITPAVHPAFDVVVATADGTAIAGTDYTVLVSVMPIAANAVTANVNLTTAENVLLDGDRALTVAVALPGAPPAGFTVRVDPAAAVSTVTITDDDQPSVVSIADATVTEGAGIGQVTISMTNPAGRTCQVSVTSADVTATAPGDYNASMGGFFNLVGVASDVLGAIPVDDDLVELDETYTLTIALTPAADPRCQLGDSSATVTIVSDDVASVVAINDSSVTEGTTGSTTLTMTNPAGRFCQVAVTSANGSAIAPGDYNPFSGGNFNLDGVASDVLSLSALDDSDVEGTESFTLTIALTAASDGQCALGDTSATILIVDTDIAVDMTAPTAVVAPAATQESPTLDTTIVFTVQFSEPVVGFATGEAVLSGSGGATTQVITAVDLDTFEVAVSGMAGPGAVTVTVPAAVANDASGNDNTASNSATVEFVDAPPISLIVPANIVRNNDPGQAGAVVTFAPATASGGVPPVVVACNRTSGEFYPIGTTTVTCTATDGESDDVQMLQQEAAVSASFTIQVIDAEPPVIADLADLTRQTTDNTPVVVTFELPVASDNSGIAPTVNCSPVSGSSFVVGTTTVTCTATDGVGLTASSSFTVTVTNGPGSGVVTPTTVPLTSVPVPPGDGGLPATGTDLGWILVLGLLLLAGGSVLVGVRRRRTT